MSDDGDEPAWPPAMWSEQLQQFGAEAADQQAELFRQMMQATSGTGSSGSPFGGLGPMGMGTAVFKTRVQSGGRISIPDAEREALDIEEGDIVQTVVVPIKSGDSE